MPRTSTRQMRGLWGYNALQTGFHSFKVNDTLSGFIPVRRHSVAAKQHILVRLMQVKLHQLGLREMGMLEPGCMELSFAQGAGLSRDRRKASRKRFFHTGVVYGLQAVIPFCLPAAALLRVTSKS